MLGVVASLKRELVHLGGNDQPRKSAVATEIQASNWEASQHRRLVESGVGADAFERLKGAYGSPAVRLYSFWLMLVQQGEDYVKTQFSRATFSRNQKSLKDIGLNWLDAHERATSLLENGDETLYRANTKDRYVAECQARGNGARKFSNPLFMTPAGYLDAFPEVDDHLFTNFDAAWKTVAAFGTKEHQGRWQVSTTTLVKELRSKRYLRWLQEVKPMQGSYTEPRRTLEDRAAIYKVEGLPGLRDRYTKSHALNSRRLIVASGLGKMQRGEVVP